jgi:hypothetical protein
VGEGPNLDKPPFDAIGPLAATPLPAPPDPTTTSYVPDASGMPDDPLSFTTPEPPPPPAAPAAPPPPTTTYSTLDIEAGAVKLPELVKV